MHKKNVNPATAMPTSLNGRYVMDAVDPLPYDLRYHHRRDAYCSVVKQKRSGTTELNARDCTMHNAIMDLPGVVDADVLRSLAYVRFDPDKLLVPVHGVYFDYEAEKIRSITYTDGTWWVRYSLDHRGRSTAAELDDLTTTSRSQAERVATGMKMLPPDTLMASGFLLPPRKPSGARRGSTKDQRGKTGTGTMRKIRSARRSFVTDRNP